MLRFAGFELDEQRAELRGPDGGPVKLRPKTFEMLRHFTANAGRLIGKEELMEAVWPNVHVSEDGVFQCIRELRAAIGDTERQLIKVVPGRGYLFDIEVSGDTAVPSAAAPAAAPPTPERLRFPFRLSDRIGIAGLAAVFAVLGLAIAAPALFSVPAPPTLAANPIVDASGDPAGARLAAAVADRLSDGLAQTESIRVVASPAAGGTTPVFIVESELGKDRQSWTLKAKLIERVSGEVHAVVTVAVPQDLEIALLQSRLAAGVGDGLARSLNALLEGKSAGSRGTAPTTSSKVAIEQATASINQTSRERFGVAEAMLKDALAAEPDNVDVQVALAALQLRGIQMVWYDGEERAAAESNAGALLARAVSARPRSIAVLEAQCRFLSATNAFAESLVTCGQVLSFDPWDGLALYLIGLGQLHLGRFEDALKTFEEADLYDTPAVSRWTWLLGAAWANVFLGRNEAALPLLERSIAITPASGRSHMMLAVAYQRLGRTDEARAAFAKAMEIRPGSTVANIVPPLRNASPVFVAAMDDYVQTMVELGLPAR